MGLGVGVLVTVGVRVFVGVRVMVGVRVSVEVRDGGTFFVFVGIGGLETGPRGVFVGGGVETAALPWKICALNRNRVSAANRILKRNTMRNEKLMPMAFIERRTKRGKYSRTQIYNHPTLA